VPDLSDTRSQLLAALRRSGGATGRQLAGSTGLAYSTVTRLLRDLAELGLATRQDSPAGQARTAPALVRTPAIWRAASAATPPAAGHDDPASTGETPPATAEATAQNATEPPPDAAREPSAEPSAEPTAEPAVAESRPPAATVARLGKGDLRAQVLAVLHAHAGEERGPTQIAKTLSGRSPGAIANACDRLVADGHAQLTNDKPRRYTATAPAPRSGTATTRGS
jgi:hypothetical protein